MNDFSDLLRHDTVLAGVSAANKKTLFQALAAAAAWPAGQDAKLLAGCCHDHTHFTRADPLIHSILLDLYSRVQVWICLCRAG